MSVKLPKIKHYLFLIAICLTSIVVMQDYVVTPVANALYELFPDSVGGVNFILSGPYIVSFFAALLAPNLLKFTSKKTLLSITCVVFTVCAIGEIAILSLPYMIAMRCICGFCYGIVQVIALDIAADYFVDENKRASFMGIYNAMMALIGAAMGMVAGNLAVSGWQNAYLTYWVAVPMTILVILFVPKLQSLSQSQAEENTEAAPAAGKASMGSRFWIALITVFIFSVCYTPMSMLASLYVSENALGNEAVSGLAASLGTVGSCVCCLAFGFLYSKLKGRTSMISFVAMTLGLLGMYFLPSKYLFLTICTLCGGGYGMFFSYAYAHIPSIVPPQNMSRAISLVTAVIGLASFLGTYVITGLMEIMPAHTITSTCVVLGIVLAITTVLEFINTRKVKETV